ncbi:hypothetical protein Tco_1405310 [Tanacetum coccineum]
MTVVDRWSGGGSSHGADFDDDADSDERPRGTNHRVTRGYESRNVEYSDKVLLHLEMVLLGLVDRNNADVIPCKVSYADDSINLNVDKSTIPSDPILQSSFARCLIEVNSEADLVDVVTIGIPSLFEDDFTKETIRVEYEWRPPRCDTCKIFGHVHDYCPKKVVSPPIVATSNVVTPNFTGPSVKHNVRYEPKATTSAPKKGTTYVGYTSQSTPMLKTTGNSSKKDNLSMSNSFSALNEEKEEDEKDVKMYGDSFAFDPDPNSFNDSPNFSDYPPQPQYQTYSCELCGNDAHYGYDCPPQVLFYSVVHQPPQETSTEMLQAIENLMEAIQAFLKKYDQIPPKEKSMALLLAEERFLKIKQAVEEEQNQPKNIQELLKLINDLQILNGIQLKQEEQAAKVSSQYWKPPIFYDDDDNDDEESSIPWSIFISKTFLCQLLSTPTYRLRTLS